MSRTTIIPVLAVVGLAACDLDTETITYVSPTSSVPIQQVVTNLDVGTVILQPASGTPGVSVTAVTWWKNEAPTLTFHTEGTTVYVDSDCPANDPKCRVDLTLNVPPDADYEVHGQDSLISASKLGGLGKLSTVEGDFLLDQLAGPVELKIDESGQILGNALTSSAVVATVGEGPITLAFNSGADAVWAHTEAGDISLAVPPSSYRIDADAVDGELDIGVDDDAEADRWIYAHTLQGDISIQPQDALLGEPFTLKFGQTLKLAEEPLSLRFDAVVEDSRCPTDLLCVWAGRFIAAMTLEHEDGDSENFELELGKPATVLGFSVQLSDAQPAPNKDQAVPDPKDYVLTVAVERI